MGLVNAAANRLYYAAFQAGVHALESKGRHWTEFRDNAKKWEHGMIAGNTNLIRNVAADRKLYSRLRNYREEADYQVTSVNPKLVEATVADLRGLVEAVAK